MVLGIEPRLVLYKQVKCLIHCSPLPTPYSIYFSEVTFINSYISMYQKRKNVGDMYIFFSKLSTSLFTTPMTVQYTQYSKLQFNGHLNIYLGGGHILLCSGLISSSVITPGQCSGGYMRCWGLRPDQVHAKTSTLPMVLSGLFFNLALNTFIHILYYLAS